jgi:nucleoside-diphosphate-sugar epimerase
VAAVRVLITGSAGFLGRHFTARLRADGHVGVAIDIVDSPLGDAVDFFQRDDGGFDLVLHLAAVSPHRAAIDGRALAVGAGALALDAAMFEWAARTRPGRVVYFSSSAAYPTYLQTGEFGELEESVIREHPGEPDAIYGWVKLTGERLASAYRQQGGLVTIVRPFSGYGEDQSSSFPFGAFRIRAAGRENPFHIWGDGAQVRDFVHVDDIVGAVLAAVERDVDGPVNICTGIGTSMRELAGLFAAVAGYRPAYELHPEAPAGVAYRVGDPTRLHALYVPRISIEEGVKRALEAGS